MTYPDEYTLEEEVERAALYRIMEKMQGKKRRIWLYRSPLYCTETGRLKSSFYFKCGRYTTWRPEFRIDLGGNCLELVGGWRDPSNYYHNYCAVLYRMPAESMTRKALTEFYRLATKRPDKPVTTKIRRE